LSIEERLQQDISKSMAENEIEHDFDLNSILRS